MCSLMLKPWSLHLVTVLTWNQGRGSRHLNEILLHAVLVGMDTFIHLGSLFLIFSILHLIVPIFTSAIIFLFKKCMKIHNMIWMHLTQYAHICKQFPLICILDTLAPNICFWHALWGWISTKCEEVQIFKIEDFIKSVEK